MYNRKIFFNRNVLFSCRHENSTFNQFYLLLVFNFAPYTLPTSYINIYNNQNTMYRKWYLIEKIKKCS